MGAILVGVDGSVGSERALQWAVNEAAVRACAVHVFNAYKAEYWYYVDVPPAAVMLSQPEMEKAAHALVDNAIEAVDVPGSVSITVECVNSSNPARELVDRSPRFDLMVLGSRGHGGLAGLFLGSVTLKVVQHAECPVTIIPAAG